MPTTPILLLIFNTSSWEMSGGADVRVALQGSCCQASAQGQNIDFLILILIFFIIIWSLSGLAQPVGMPRNILGVAQCFLLPQKLP